MTTPSSVMIFVLRNTGGAYYAQATITNYASLTYERSLWGVGQFEFTMAANILGANQIEVDSLIIVSDAYGVRNDRIGVVNAVERSVSESGQMMTVRGMELKGILGWRLINPGTSDRYHHSGTAEYVMKGAVNMQCVSAVNAARNIPGLSIATDQGRGETYDMSERWSNLAEALQACGKATGMGWTIYWTGSAFIFDVIPGKNRTMGNGVNAPLIISSDYDTAKESTYSQTKESYKNLSYTLGQGVGTDRVLRTIYTGSAEPVGLLRREMYTDARDLVTVGELDARGAQKLFENNYTTAVEASINPFSIAFASSQVDLGDMVTVQYFDFNQTSQVTGITEQWSESGYDVQFALDKQPNGIAQVGAVNAANTAFTQTAAELPAYTSTATGYYVKHDDGRLEQYGSFAVAAGAWSGGPWSSAPFSKHVTLTFPLAFISTAYQDSLTWSITETNARSYSWPGYYNLPTASATGFYIFNAVNDAVTTIVLSWQITGRWK